MSLSEQLQKRLFEVSTKRRNTEDRLVQRDEYLSKSVEAKALISNIKSSIELYKKGRYVTNKLQASKKQRDSESIKKSMEVASTLVLKGNDSVPYFKTSDGALPESKLVIDMGDRVVPLSLVEGTGFNESVSLMVLTSILSATQYTKFLFLDEFFSSVSGLNSQRISQYANDMFDGKFQVILIEQKDDIVKHTAHREFYIELIDGVSVVTTYDVDKEGNKTLVEV